MKFDDLKLTINGEPLYLPNEEEVMSQRLRYLARRHSCIIVGLDDWRVAYRGYYNTSLMNGDHFIYYGMDIVFNSAVPSGHYYDERMMSLL
jgi:hypothetical protein